MQLKQPIFNAFISITSYILLLPSPSSHNNASRISWGHISWGTAPIIQIHRLNRYLYHRSKLNGHPAAKLQILSVLLVILIGQNCDSIHIIIILSYSCVI